MSTTATRPPEWLSVLETIRTSRTEQGDAWQALAGFDSLIVYTDGSAPEQNPGGVTGFASILCDAKRKNRLDLAGHIPARLQEPPTSNNRAEIAGVLATLEALRQLVDEHGARAKQVVVWCDSQYVIKCATGAFKRHKNRDLWSVYDGVESRLRRAGLSNVELRWTKGHAGTELNEEADRLAKAAALGQPLAAAEVKPEADYELSMSKGRYLLKTRTGRSSVGELGSSGGHPDAAEYLTLKMALGDLLERIEAAGRDSSGFQLRIRSARELVVKQLQGTYQVRSVKLKPLYEKVRGLLNRFGGATFEQVDATELKDELWLEES
ncbi:MAG: RNase H family protein [Vulcanimicrobiota bacterium]